MTMSAAVLETTNFGIDQADKTRSLVAMVMIQLIPTLELATSTLMVVRATTHSTAGLGMTPSSGVMEMTT